MTDDSRQASPVPPGLDLDPARAGRTERAVNALLTARRGGATAAGLPPDARPEDPDDAYRVQREVMRRLGATIGGWKVAMDDDRHGRSAPLFAADIHASPAKVALSPTLRVPPTLRVGVEPEIAFRMARSLPPQPGGQPYTRAQVIAAIGSAHAVIEILTSRFTTQEGASVLEQLTDNLSNGGLVLGPALPQWQHLAIDTLPLRWQLGTRVVRQGRGGHPLGDPLLPLHWLANHLAAATPGPGHPSLGASPGLQAGQIVTTGSCAGLYYLEPGSQAVAEFTDLGTVVLERG